MADTSSQARWTSVFAHKFLPRVILDDEMSGKLLEIFANPEAADPLLNFLIDNVALACGFPEGTWKTLALDVHLHRRRFGAAEGIVIEMPPPQIPPDCYFIGIVPTTKGRARYFTLESTLIPPPTMLCEWRPDGSHANFGPGPQPDIDLFVIAVSANLDDKGAD